LIIEDEPMIAMLLQDLLEDAGATSFSFAATEQDAVALALERRPAVITSDIRLLQGTGPGAVAQINHEIGSIPVVFITANTEVCDRSGPLTSVLSKPFSSHDAIALFQEIIQR
jgi:CheY-like chemotaxis protein